MTKRKENKWQPLPATLLYEYETRYQTEINEKSAKEKEMIISGFFKNNGINATVSSYVVGDSITKYTIECDTSIAEYGIKRLSDELKSKIKGTFLKANISNDKKIFLNIEIPNDISRTVPLRDVYNSLPNITESPLAFAFGRDLNGNNVIGNLQNISNLLIVGTKGSGNSMFLNSIITTLIMRNSPEDLKIALFDYKNTILSAFSNIPHLLYPVVSSYKAADKKAKELFNELGRRYSLFKEVQQENIFKYNGVANTLGIEKLPHIIAFVSDISDFMADNCRGTFLSTMGVLAVIGKRAGIHVVFGTHRFPKNTEADLKSHFSNKIAFKNSKGLINKNEEKKLLGCGDMLIESEEMFPGEIKRVQGCFIHRKEIEKIVCTLSGDG